LIGKTQEAATMPAPQPVAPLTIIAIFAGIIESSALATLPFLSEESQSLYTWFLVGFPFFLTALFFLTLNFNYRSLYKPDDAAKDDPTQAPLLTETLAFSPPQQANTESRLIQPRNASEPVTIMLCGPDAQKIIEQHLLRTLAQPQVIGSAWLYCDLNKHQCFRLSVSELPHNATALMN